MGWGGSGHFSSFTCTVVGRSRNCYYIIIVLTGDAMVKNLALLRNVVTMLAKSLLDLSLISVLNIFKNYKDVFVCLHYK